jgi:hypothetical protein
MKYKPEKDIRTGVAIRMNTVEKGQLYDLCKEYKVSSSAMIRKLVAERHARVVK